MDEKIKKIIFITAYPFNQQDYNRFGIEILRRNGLTVEIWDITSCLHKNFEDQLREEDPVNVNGLRIFKQRGEICNAISVLDKGCLINCFIEYSIKTFFVFRAISKFKIDYFVFGMVSFPSPYSVQTSIIQKIGSIPKKISSLKFREIFEHILNKILLKYYFIFGIAPAAIILLGGTKSIESSLYPVNTTTTRLWTHSLDYDIYLQQCIEPDAAHSVTGVFLDEYLPLHPDFLYMGIKSPISSDDYYPKVCSFFEILEKNMNARILIAAHPKSDYESSPDYFRGRIISKGNTALLVRKSSFVIAHMSTSITFAVLYEKPVLFITMDNLQKLISGKYIPGLYIPSIASELGRKTINIDHVSGFDLDREMEIDHEAYFRYRDLYIKKQGTPEKPLWEIFCSYIKQDKMS